MNRKQLMVALVVVILSVGNVFLSMEESIRIPPPYGTIGAMDLMRAQRNTAINTKFAIRQFTILLIGGLLIYNLRDKKKDD